jgi:hypothetical protein
MKITQIPTTGDQMVNNRTEILNEAIELINGERNSTYGDPLDDFLTTATFWQTYITRTIEARGGLDIKPHDVAVMMNLLKTARISWSPEKRDHWADLAGYTGCGWDCVVRQDD